MKTKADGIGWGPRLMWLADNGASDQGAPSNAGEPEKDAPGKVDPDKPGQAETFDREYVEELRRENAKWRRQVRDIESKLEDQEAARKTADDERLAKQQEWQTLAEQRAKEIDTLKAQLKQKDVDVLRVRVAAEYGLNVPLGEDGGETLADRLRGATEDELRADAQKLAKLLPKPAPQAEAATPPPATPDGETPPAQPPTHEARRQTTAVPGGPPVGRTDADRRAEYLTPATDSPIFRKGKVSINSKSQVVE